MRLRYTVGLAVGSFLAIWLWWGWYGASWLAARFGAEELAKMGLLGDLFGGINALFSAFALVGLTVAAWLQRRQILDAQDQAELTRAQHQRSMFEPLLFALLDRHKTPENLFNGLTGSIGTFNSVASGIYEELTKTGHYKAASFGGDPSAFLHAAREIYEYFYQSNDSRLGPYFRSIYHVFRHVSQSAIPETDKAMYASIARAGL